MIALGRAVSVRSGRAVIKGLHSVTDPSVADLIAEFVRGEYPRVVAAVAMTTGASGDAEDAVQEALIKVLSDHRRPERLGAWVTVVAINRVRSGQRRGAAEHRAVERLPSHTSPDEASQVSDEVTLRNVVSTLPDRQREIVLLYYYLDTPVAEIAGALGVTEGTVKTQLHRARSTIAKALGEDEETS